MKRLLFFSMMALFFVPLGLISFYKWDSSVNRGSEFGYWGEFNATSNALASIPGVTINSSWQNEDVTLEEFGFEITTNGVKGRLLFGERSPIRAMSQRRAVVALQERIGRGVNSTNRDGLWCTFEPFDSTMW